MPSRGGEAFLAGRTGLRQLPCRVERIPLPAGGTLHPIGIWQWHGASQMMVR